MPLPDPRPGLVIRYAFLWPSEALRGQQEGSKDRPCTVVLAVMMEDNRTRVVVAPLTTVDPGVQAAAVEVPVLTQQRLGLGGGRSWIITDQVNVFEWPGPDIRPVPQQSADPKRRFAYGFLGPKTLMRVIDGIQAQRSRRALSAVRRDDPQ